MHNLTGHKVGFIGLGLMGRPMSLQLHRAGARVVVHNRSRGVVHALSALGLQAAESAQQVAEQSDTIVLMLSDTMAVREALFGRNGVSEGLRSGHLLIDMGTTGALETREFAEIVMARGAEFVDAPVSGGVVGAEAADLTIMVGGSDTAYDRAIPLLSCLGKRITRVGDVGAGQVAKAANQVIVGLTIGAVAEAFSLARAAGVDPSKVQQALKGGFADSRILELHGRRMIERNFAPGGKVVTQRKDMRQALELAATLDLELPATELNERLYEQLIQQGGGELDHSALIKVIEKPG